MPTLNIQLPTKQFKIAKVMAKKEGFRAPNDWVRALISRWISLEESPKIKPPQIISEMEKTGLYKIAFLKGLKRSLEYADKTAKRPGQETEPKI